MPTRKSSKTDETRLFAQITEYLSLGNRIGKGLLNIFDTIFTRASEGKAAALAQFSYTVGNDPAEIRFIFTISSTSSGKPRTAKVEVVIRDGETYMALRNRTKDNRYPLSLQGVRDLLADAKIF